jgi:hypothetical protein
MKFYIWEFYKICQHIPVLVKIRHQEQTLSTKTYMHFYMYLKYNSLNIYYTAPWPLVRKRTIRIERPQLVGEVSANFLRIEDVTSWLVQRVPMAVNLGFLERTLNIYQSEKCCE